MIKTDWLEQTRPAFRLMISTSWLAPESWRQNQEAPSWKPPAPGRTGQNISLGRSPPHASSQLGRCQPRSRNRSDGICQAGIAEAQRRLPHEVRAALPAFGRRAEAV